MLFIVGLALSVVFLEWPWQLLVVIPLALVEIGEIFLWLKLRDMPEKAGASTLVGREAEVVEECAPMGQVKVAGQIWTAVSSSPVPRYAKVVVTGFEGIRLQVAPQSSSR